ncbi:uncharacterized protein LOC132200040 [Neocloeon triangulifer]|uniref:uncharacterized protein LOC132200040 n=1 Tax=Neocloeon triangulifer TaxID=2078957 RepID=UPI00286ED188|nr:uncharacterized protein LOC132200040 [Neocloeon triangulifer]
MEEENREKEASLILHSMLTNKREQQLLPRVLTLECEASSSTNIELLEEDEEDDVNVMETDDDEIGVSASKDTESEDDQKLRNEKKKGQRKKRKISDYVAQGIDPTKLEESADEVMSRFKLGCECVESNCFTNLNAELVYRHRLNIAELTKAEQDMYLMGVTMASLTNPETTTKQKERQRLRAQYVYQGRKVCLDAFLYLENCTHYQLKRIRKHVMTHGVVPRMHGNLGKKPHNTFSLDIYRHANNFIESFIEPYTAQTNNQSKSKGAKKKITITLPPKITRKTLHNEYKDYCAKLNVNTKIMGYSSFRHFISEQFPNIRFVKNEVGVPKPANLELYEPRVHEVEENPTSQATSSNGSELAQSQQEESILTTQLLTTQTLQQQAVHPTIIMDGNTNTTFTTPAGNTYVITQVLPAGFCQVPATFQTVSISADNQAVQPTTFTFTTS